MSNRRWDRIARTEPYYAVLTHPRYLASHLGGNAAPFFESGDAEVTRLLAAIRAVDLRASLESVLEFGCGPGRLLPAFLRQGMSVTAVDHSANMLALARENTATFDRPPVFIDAKAFLAAPPERRFDLVHLARVLQHVSTREGQVLVRELARRVRLGGYLQLDFPFRTSRSAVSQASLLLRRMVPLLNAVANRAKRRSAQTPVLPVQLHSLDAIAEILQTSGMEILDITVQQENELMTARVLARAMGAPEVHASSRFEEPPADLLSPRDLIRTTTLEQLSARAEEYFARMESFEAQLAKPFASGTEAPDMLISLGALLHGMKLAPGMTVLDFGGGTGWLSRAFAQMGCRVILSDVSPTALRVARESNAQHPSMQFLLFDGRHIDLEDESVDRIVSFDAFHHIPNPDDVLAELGRVLRPGGLAGFSEPGPQHSRSAQSQYEMRSYGVLENDVDIHAIWKTAQSAGFDDIRACAFDGAPLYITLEEFDELLDGGPALQRSAKHLREFVVEVRTFILHKRGEETADSRTIHGLRSRIDVAIEARANADEPIPFSATIENIGTATWLPSNTHVGGVSLGVHLYREDALVNFDFAWTALSEAPLPPGSKISVEGTLPPLAAGRYRVDFDCVANGVTWFQQAGSEVASRTLEVERRRPAG